MAGDQGLRGGHQIYMGDGDVQRQGPGVVVNLALLEVQAGLGPGCHVLGQTAPDISRRNKLPGGEPPPGWEMLC